MANVQFSWQNVSEGVADIYYVSDTEMGSFLLKVQNVTLTSAAGGAVYDNIEDSGVDVQSTLIRVMDNSAQGQTIPKTDGASQHFIRLNFTPDSGATDICFMGDSSSAATPGGESSFTISYGQSGGEFCASWEGANANPDPTAIITAPTAGASISSGSPLGFDGSSSHDMNGATTNLSYAWTFGDGGTSAAATGNHTYTSAGDYTISLTVTDLELSTTNTAQVNITVAALDYSIAGSVTPNDSKATFSITIGADVDHAHINVYNSDGEHLGNYHVGQTGEWSANLSYEVEVGYGTFTAQLIPTNGEHQVLGDDIENLSWDQGSAPDDVAPVITLTHGGEIWYQKIGTAFSEPGFTATDNVDGDITGDVTVTGWADGSSPAGDYSVKYNVSDAAGNAATQQIRNLTVHSEPSVDQVNTQIHASHIRIIEDWDPGSVNAYTIVLKNSDGGEVATENNATVENGNNIDLADKPIGNYTVDVILNVSAEHPQHDTAVLQWTTEIMWAGVVDYTVSVSHVQSGDATTFTFVRANDNADYSGGDGVNHVHWILSDQEAQGHGHEAGVTMIYFAQYALSASVEVTSGYGDHRLTYYAVDGSHNMLGDQLQYDYDAGVENQPPVLSPIGGFPNYILNWHASDSYVDPGATAVDGEGHDISNFVAVSGDIPTLDRAGTYDVIYTVWDLDHSPWGTTSTDENWANRLLSDTTTRTVHVSLSKPTVSAAADANDPQGKINVSYVHGESWDDGDHADGNGEPSLADIYRKKNVTWPYDAANDPGWDLVASANAGSSGTEGNPVVWVDTDVNPGWTLTYMVKSRSDDYQTSEESDPSTPVQIPPDQAPVFEFTAGTSETLDKQANGTWATPSDPPWSATDPEGYTNFTLHTSYSGPDTGNPNYPSETGPVFGTHSFTYWVTEDTNGTASNQEVYTLSLIDLQLEVATGPTVDDSSLPASVDFTINVGQSIDGWLMTIYAEDGVTEVDSIGGTNWLQGIALAFDITSPGEYSYILTGTGNNSSVAGGTGTFTVNAAALEFHSVAVTSDALPWSMANVRWGLHDGTSLPSDMRVQIERKTGLDGNWTAITSNQMPDAGGLNGSTGTGYYDEGLTPATTYYYRLIFVDTEGTQSSYSVEVEYATIAIPNLATADVNTRGKVHPELTITGAEVHDWYWTTEAVASPELRTKADWDADANAHHVSQGTWGVVMDHLGAGAGSSTGDHAPGAYTVIIAGFWHDGTPLTPNMDPGNNTVLVVPYNVFRGGAAVTSEFTSNFEVEITVTEPNDSFDWSGVRWSTQSPVGAGLSDWPGTSYSSWGSASSDGAIVAPDPGGTGSVTYYVVPVSDENDERIDAVYTTTIYRWSGLNGVNVTVSGNNLSDNNVTATVSPSPGYGPQWRYSTESAPPANSSLSNWGTPVTDGNTVTFTRRSPGGATLWAHACFPDGTPIGSTMSTSFTVSLAPYTGLTDLTFAIGGDDGGVTLQAHGYFPQWRYYIGVLPIWTEYGQPMAGDMGGTPVDEDPAITPDGPPSEVGITVEVNKRVVIIGIATDGTQQQHIVGKPLIRVLHIANRTAAEEWKVRNNSRADFDGNDIPVAVLNSKEVDENGQPTKTVVSTTLDRLSDALPWWSSKGLTSNDMGNFFVPGASTETLRTVENLTWLMPRVSGLAVRLDDDGNEMGVRNRTFIDWANDDGVTAHMGVDISAELASNFAGVDDALATVINADFGTTITTMKDVVTATAAIDLTGSSTGTEKWPDRFVKERVKQLRYVGALNKDTYDGLLYGARVLKPSTDGINADGTVGADFTIPWKRADISEWYPEASATITAGNHTLGNARDLGGRITGKDAYEKGYIYPKLRHDGYVDQDNFHKRAPKFPVTNFVRPDTGMNRTPPRTPQQGNRVLDMLNDRASGKFGFDTPKTPSEFLSDNVPADATALAFLTGPTLIVDYTGSGDIIEKVSDPKMTLFIRWSTKTDDMVPLEILARYLEYGNAVTEETLQAIYDLEVTEDVTVQGTGRNRTEWKNTITDFAAIIGVNLTT